MSGEIFFQNVFMPGTRPANNMVPIPLMNGNFWVSDDALKYDDFSIGGRYSYRWHLTENAVDFQSFNLACSPLNTLFYIWGGSEVKGYIIVDPTRNVMKYNALSEEVETEEFEDGFVSESISPTKNMPLKYLATTEVESDIETKTVVEGGHVVDEEPMLFFRFSSGSYETLYSPLWVQPELFLTDTENNLVTHFDAVSSTPYTTRYTDYQRMLVLSTYTYTSGDCPYTTYHYPVAHAQYFGLQIGSDGVTDSIFYFMSAIPKYVDYGGNAVYKCDIRFRFAPYNRYFFYEWDDNWGSTTSEVFTLTWRESEDYPGYLYLEPFSETITFTYDMYYSRSFSHDPPCIPPTHYSYSTTWTISMGGVPTCDEDLENCGRVGNLYSSYYGFRGDGSTNPPPNILGSPVRWIRPNMRPVVFVPAARVFTEMLSAEIAPENIYYPWTPVLDIEIIRDSIRVEFDTQSYNMTDSSSLSDDVNNLVSVSEDLVSSVEIAPAIESEADITQEPYEETYGDFICLKESVTLGGGSVIHPVTTSPDDSELLEHKCYFGCNTGDAPHSNYAFFGNNPTKMLYTKDGVQMDMQGFYPFFDGRFSVKDNEGVHYLFHKASRDTDPFELNRIYPYDPDSEEEVLEDVEYLGMYHGLFKKDGSVYAWRSYRCGDISPESWIVIHKYLGEDEVEEISIRHAEGAMSFYAEDNTLIHLQGNEFVFPRTNTKFNISTGESEKFVPDLANGVIPQTFRGLTLSTNKLGLHYEAEMANITSPNVFEGGGVLLARQFTSFSSEETGFFVQGASGQTLIQPFEFEPGTSYFISFDASPEVSGDVLHGVEVRFVFESGWIARDYVSQVEGTARVAFYSPEDEPEETLKAIVLCGYGGNTKIDLSTVFCGTFDVLSDGSFYQQKGSSVAAQHMIDGEGAHFERFVNSHTGYYFEID